MRPEHPIEDEATLIIDINYLVNSLKAKWKLIAVSSLTLTVLATIFSFTLYHEKYQSVSTLLFSPGDKNSTSAGSDPSVLGGGTSIAFQNQTELLKSRWVSRRVFERLQAQKIKLPVRRAEDLQGKVLKVEPVKGSDFIKLTATASQAKAAQLILNVYKDVYLEKLRELTVAPFKEQKVLFEAQVSNAEAGLDNINQRLQDYQARYGILDMDIESENQVRQLTSLDTDAKTIEATLAQRRAEVAKIRSQLKLKQQQDTTIAIDSVASGQDSQLQKLQEQLQTAQKDYDIKAMVYSPTNPDMRQLAASINVLKQQITDQQIFSVGQTLSSKDGVIKDSVRTGLVNRLAEAESDVSALHSKLGTIQSQYIRLRSQLHNLPEEQLTYARLQLEKKSLEEVLTQLRKKLSEVKIQESMLHEQWRPIDPSSLPDTPLFPQRWHIISIAALAGAILSMIAVTGQALCLQREVRPEFVENTLGLPVLSMLPWLSDGQWQQYRHRNLLEMTASWTDPTIIKAYQDLALNLKAQRNALHKNTLVLSSLAQGAGHSIILANLAFCLAQSGERVLLVDTNLRKPRLHATFSHTLNYEKSLPELINSISEVLYRKPNATGPELIPFVEQAALPSGLHPQLFYLNAGVAIENTFEFLNSKGFGTLVQAAKSEYDWVLLDAPPFLQAPDAAVLLGYADGLLLLVEKDADEAQMQAVYQKINRLNSNIVGTILRSSTL